MLTINNPYISVGLESAPSYGGRQQSFKNANIARCGCGVIAAADTLLYLSRFHEDCAISRFNALKDAEPIPQSAYEACVSQLHRDYFPLIPHFGMNALGLSCGMNLFFRRSSMPLKAQWGFFGDKLWERMADMLSADIPVIMSVGPNFPRVWQACSIPFYTLSADGLYRPAAAARGHYITATGLDDEWICISSWGCKYYINRREYSKFAAEHTTNLLSNILYISHI